MDSTMKHSAIIPGTYLDVRTTTPVAVTHRGDGFIAIWQDGYEWWDEQRKSTTAPALIADMIGRGVLILEARTIEAAS
jgi:hypothetical protein